MRWLIVVALLFAGCGAADTSEYLAAKKDLDQWTETATDAALNYKGDVDEQKRVLLKFKELLIEKHKALSEKYEQHSPFYQELLATYGETEERKSREAGVAKDLGIR